MEKLETILLLALVNATVMLVIHKYGGADLYSYIRNRYRCARWVLLQKKYCELCTAFWLAVPFSVAATAVTGDIGWLATPCYTASLTSMVYKICITNGN